MHLGAHVLLPEGFDSSRSSLSARYYGYFPSDFGGFREAPPDPNLKPDYNERFKLAGYNRIVQEHGHQFYKEWTGPNFPRFIIIEIQHANPYYDDSYAVNSANLGPYGDAITYELIPEIEKRFRGIGKARFLYGGSTGGWEAMAVQIFYPDEYNGSWAALGSDRLSRLHSRQYMSMRMLTTPISGSAYCVPEAKLSRKLSATVEDMNHMELRWVRIAVPVASLIFGKRCTPVGSNGYPKPIWDKLTGRIDRSVAEYWRENFDLGYILKRDWAKIDQSWKASFTSTSARLTTIF